MDSKYLEEIKAREQAATKGPWNWKNDVLLAPEPSYLVLKPFLEESNDEPTVCIFPNDKDFIAHARTDIPALIAEVKSLNQELKSAREIEEHKATRIIALEKIIEKRESKISMLKKALELACNYVDSESQPDTDLETFDYFIQQAQEGQK